MRKLTKRQRKELRGPNHAAMQSIAHGKSQLVAGTRYLGSNPVYVEQSAPGQLTQYRKVSHGIPFVRA